MLRLVLFGQSCCSRFCAVAQHPRCLSPDCSCRAAHVAPMVLSQPSTFVCPEVGSCTCQHACSQTESGVGSKRKDLQLRMKVYEGSFHGFAIRGDARDPKIQAARQDGAPALKLKICCTVSHKLHSEPVAEPPVRRPARLRLWWSRMEAISDLWMESTSCRECVPPLPPHASIMHTCMHLVQQCPA